MIASIGRGEAAESISLQIRYAVRPCHVVMQSIYKNSTRRILIDCHQNKEPTYDGTSEIRGQLKAISLCTGSPDKHRRGYRRLSK